MPADYAEVLADFEAEESRLVDQLARVRAAMPAIKEMLQRTAPNAAAWATGRFYGMGATKAIPILLADKTVPMTYREIHDALKAEGWTTTATDPASTVSATLSQLRGVSVEKVGEGWRALQQPAAQPDYADQGITDDDIPF